MQEHDGGSAGKTISPVAFLWASYAPMLPSQQGCYDALADRAQSATLMGLPSSVSATPSSCGIAGRPERPIGGAR